MDIVPRSETRLPILATAVVPWTTDYRFDAETFRREVRTIARGLTRQIYIFGTAGEGYAVSDDQFREIATCFWESAREERVSPMLGIISASLPTITERIEWARRLGFRQFQLSLTSWGALNDIELDSFFAETCGRYLDCRFLHYNLARTKRVLTAADYRRLCDAHPNLVAVKTSVSDPAVIRELMALAPRLEFFFTERGYIEARRLGECGFLISLASVNYTKAKTFVMGDETTRQQMLNDIQELAVKMKAISGGRYHIDGAFDKMLFKIHDASFPLRVLPPYQGASDEDFAIFRKTIPLGWQT